MQSYEHEIQDLTSELKVLKQRDEFNQQKIKDLQYEIEEMKPNQDNSSFIGNTSLQGSMMQDLELKVQQLQHENDILKMNNQSTISAKLIELES